MQERDGIAEGFADADAGYQKQADLVLKLATETFEHGVTWPVYHECVFGVGGLVERCLPDGGERRRFEQSPEYAELQQLLRRLRERQHDDRDDKPVQRVITVRMPQSLHEALRVEAHNKRTSMNKLCISKLLQPTDQSLVPEC